MQRVIARVISRSDRELEARGRFENTSAITPWIVRHEVQLLINCICNKNVFWEFHLSENVRTLFISFENCRKHENHVGIQL